MPNWVYCGFIVSGEPAEIARLKARIFRTVPSAEAFGSLKKTGTEVVFDFDAVVPMPAERKPYDEDWAWENWGVKWNAIDLSMNEWADDRFQFQFTTAWEFPTPIFDVLAKEFPTLTFSGSAYEESDAFSLGGEINGKDDWGEIETKWSDLGSGDEDEDGEDDGRILD